MAATGMTLWVPTTSTTAARPGRGLDTLNGRKGIGHANLPIETPSASPVPVRVVPARLTDQT